MNKLKAIIENYKYIFFYILIIICIGIWQLLDWYFGLEDPIWHLLFYIWIIPILSLVFGIFVSNYKKCFLMPFIAYITNIIVYIIFANGGLSFDIEALYLSIIPFFAMIVGIIIRKVLLLIENKLSK